MAYTSVKISADSSSYQSQMKSAASQMKVLSAEYTTAATKAKLFGSETDSLKAKAESLTQKITVQKNIVQLNSEQQEKLTKKLSDQKTKQEELKTKIDAAPIPAIPAETTDIFFPKLSIFVPAVSQAVANFSSLLSFSWSLTFFSSASMFMRAVFDFSVFTV